MSTAFLEQFSTARPEGPAWLSQVRERAMASFQAAGFPTMRNEDWHFTNPAPIAESTFEAMRAPTGAVTADPAVDPPVVAPSVDAITSAVLKQVLYGTPSERLHAAIVADLEWQSTTDPRKLVARALALAIGSPEFQRY